MATKTKNKNHLILITTALCCVFLVGVGSAEARDYFVCVSESSCDNGAAGFDWDQGIDTNNGLYRTGTPPNGPFLTIQKCADVMNAGDTCTVGDGTYQHTGVPDGPLVNVTKSNSCSARDCIIFRSENKWGAKLNGQESQSSILGNVIGLQTLVKGVTFEDFEVYNWRQAGINFWQPLIGTGDSAMGDNGYGTARGNKVWGSSRNRCTKWAYGSGGGINARASNMLIENNIVYNNGRLVQGEACDPNRTFIWPGKTNTELIVEGGSSQKWRYKIDYCTDADARAAAGVPVAGSPTCDYGVCTGTEMLREGHVTEPISGTPCGSYHTNDHASYMSRSGNNEFYNNVYAHNHGPSQIEFNGGGSSIFANNTVISGVGHPFGEGEQPVDWVRKFGLMQGNARYNKMVNNIFYSPALVDEEDSGHGYDIWGGMQGYPDKIATLEFYNNIVVGGNLVVFNTINLDATPNVPLQAENVDNLPATTPLFVRYDPDDIANSDFRLASNAEYAIGKGTGGHGAPTYDINRVNRGGSSYDIGAYAYTNSDTMPADVNSDTRVNIKDIQEVIRCIINPGSCNFPGQSDVNGDTHINIKDIQEIIRKIISSN